MGNTGSTDPTPAPTSTIVIVDNTNPSDGDDASGAAAVASNDDTSGLNAVVIGVAVVGVLFIVAAAIVAAVISRQPRNSGKSFRQELQANPHASTAQFATSPGLLLVSEV